MKTKTEFQAVKEAYLEQLKEQQLNERRGSKPLTGRQILDRIDTLENDMVEFENMLKQSANARGQRVSLDDYLDAVEDVRSSYLDFMDNVEKIERLLK